MERLDVGAFMKTNGAAIVACVGLFTWGTVMATNVLRSRVPDSELAATRAIKNPLQYTPEALEAGNTIYHRKGFCVACHGPSGQGFTGVDPALLKGAVPTDFTKPAWQTARTDGELMWVLRHGSPGTAMASFVPSVLTEEQAWQVIHYLRSLGGR